MDQDTKPLNGFGLPPSSDQNRFENMTNTLNNDNNNTASLPTSSTDESYPNAAMLTDQLDGFKKRKLEGEEGMEEESMYSAFSLQDQLNNNNLNFEEIEAANLLFNSDNNNNNAYSTNENAANTSNNNPNTNNPNNNTKKGGKTAKDKSQKKRVWHSWSNSEKEMFFQLIKENGKNFTLISTKIGTKNYEQVSLIYK